MPSEIDPIVDNWYCHLDKGQRFYVVAVDEDGGVVEVQHFDGDVEEIDLKEWYEMNIETAEEPESWAGAVDVGNVDDYGTEVTDTRPADWSEPLKQYRTPQK